jgi:hypothetical protein
MAGAAAPSSANYTKSMNGTEKGCRKMQDIQYDG